MAREHMRRLWCRYRYCSVAIAVAVAVAGVATMTVPLCAEQTLLRATEAYDTIRGIPGRGTRHVVCVDILVVIIIIIIIIIAGVERALASDAYVAVTLLRSVVCMSYAPSAHVCCAGTGMAQISRR